MNYKHYGDKNEIPKLEIINFEFAVKRMDSFAKKKLDESTRSMKENIEEIELCEKYIHKIENEIDTLNKKINLLFHGYEFSNSEMKKHENAEDRKPYEDIALSLHREYIEICMKLESLRDDLNDYVKTKLSIEKKIFSLKNEILMFNISKL